MKKLLVLITLIIVNLISCDVKGKFQHEVWQGGKVIDVICGKWDGSSRDRSGVYYKYIGECDK